MFNKRGLAKGALFAAILSLALALSRAGATIPEAAEGSVKRESLSGTAAIVDALSDPARSGPALEGLLRRSDAKSALTEIARSRVDAVARGWAVVGLSRLPGSDVDDTLQQLAADAEPPMLVRTWAAAGWIGRSPDLAALSQRSALRYQMPALERPIQMKAESLLQGASMRELILASADPNIAQMVAPVVISRAKVEDLLPLVYTSPEDALRRQSAAFLASLGQRDQRAAAQGVLRALRFSKTGPTPWAGGALYVPAIGWQGEDATQLTDALFRWWLRLAIVENDAAAAQQVYNNLYSIGLIYAAGYQMSFSEPIGLVREVKDRKGKDAARKLLTDVGLSGDERFEAVIR